MRVVVRHGLCGLSLNKLCYPQKVPSDFPLIFMEGETYFSSVRNLVGKNW